MSEPSVSPADTPTCDYCGSLAWTVDKYGRVTHKQGCPHRTDPWHQGDPAPVSPADTPRDLRRAAEYVVASGDTATAANWLRTAADAIESRNALLHGADEAAALLAVGERDEAEIERLESVLTDAETELAMAEAQGERDRRQIAQLTEALAFYADPVSYKNATPRTVRPVIEDQGSRARAVLVDKEDADAS